MNKKDVARIRKEFKPDNTALKVKEIYNVYTQKETGEIIHAESQIFEMLDYEQQVLFLANFKKVLSGQLDSKLFELKFNRDAEENSQHLLFRSLKAKVEEWKLNMNELVAKMYKEFSYETDVVFTFIRAEYFKPTKQKNEEAEEAAEDEVYGFDFILCSVNKIATPQKAILFDFTEKEFKSNSVVDALINLTSPLEGFMYPAFTENQADANHVLYSAGKADAPNPYFIENVLTCNYTMTASQEKDIFDKVLTGVLGDKVASETLSNIYEKVNEMVEGYEDKEPPTLDVHDVKRLLEVSGVENTDNVEKVFKKVVEKEGYEFKSTSLIPNFTSKSVKITTKTANVQLSPKDLKNVRQIINHQGKKCLLIELDEDVNIGNFKLQSERL
ncbi:DUF4317 family protein (plasmid) [Aneurinibacillus sp. Ricciae_BoGa-3]|uniref:DUF4317 family protein n=1 Tax=Aneurinibacillus sp. Ricciae_BoGa-3 TaxID=3022697 RepID=UPI002340171F|nr:DUF4317 family protein [Aneurinibacillus sp. Ricciae_BoGa-3]WCK57216.1 DUF4317 family protein [Aneurinibacillus sp. Ricciae_BoGa-3]